MTDRQRTATTCTCPPEPVHEGPGEPVRLPGRSHRRGCPVVQHIFDMQDEMARKMANEHVGRGGILPTEGQREARHVRSEVEQLRREVHDLASLCVDLYGAIVEITAHLWPAENGSEAHS